MKNKIRTFTYYFTILLSAFILSGSTFAQNHHERFNSIDVLHYKFDISLHDETNEFQGIADVKIKFKKDLETFVLDLKGLNDEGEGLIVDGIKVDDKEVEFIHQNDQIIISFTAKKRETKTFEINYHGIPDDGLIISESKFGDRVFFADCWPNRAHHWIPTVDHISDKATVEFIVHAPSHYQVVATGVNIEETNVGDQIISHWKTDIPLPTKVMVIGVARFAVQHLGELNGVPISSWVYPENREEGFDDYNIALKPVEYFSSHIAPFPFEKLANVQAKTIYGGMENAGCIFYSERSIGREGKPERLFAHEIAHQWWGDAVSASNWHHVWLSEGFATYFTSLYTEYTYGRDRFVQSMKGSRSRVVNYASRRLAPVIDTTLSVSNDLLSTNSYQKGAWFLHMLRCNLGDDLFWECIQTYYKKFEYKNALTEDFQEVVENISGEEYEQFFHQWLYLSGQPKISQDWKYKRKEIKLTLKQEQDYQAFNFPLEIKIIYEDESSSYETLSVSKAKEIFTILSEKKPKQIILDPNTCLLFEEVRINN